MNKSVPFRDSISKEDEMSRPVFFATAIAALTMASQSSAAADVLEKTVTCQNPSGAETTTTTIDLHQLSIPAAWSEGGPNYEITTSFSLGVYTGQDSSKTGAICADKGDWGTREFRKYNLWSGKWWDYALDYRLVVKNVPLGGMIELRLDLEEQDDSPNRDDHIDINPLFDNLFFKRFGESLPKDPGLNLAIYPQRRVAHLRTSSWMNKDSATTVAFDKPTNFTGAGPTSGSVDVIGRLKIAISADGYRSPGLTNVGKKILPMKSDSICRKYALSAVEDNQKAQKLGCGFQPPVWSNDHQMHFDWCMHGGNANQIASENKKRKSALQQCVANNANQGGGAQNQQASLDPCDLYAKEAIKLSAKANANGCGFFGPRWLSDYNAHHSFCASGVNPAILFAEHAARENDVRMCTGN